MKRDEKRDTRNESPIPELAGEGVAVACDPAPGEARRNPVAQRFEDLLVFKKTRPWVKRIYESTRGGAFDRDVALRDQIRRAASSVLLNLAEGFERGNRKEFRHFVEIAKASCGEVRAALLIAHDVGYMGDPDLKDLSEEAEEIGRMLGGLRRSLLRQR